MNYFLVLGILYQKFKEPAQVSISSGDRLIDSFVLNDDHPPAKLRYDQLHTPYIEKFKLIVERLSEGFEIPNFYKVYKLNEAEIGTKLKIKIKNSSNNHTNGFMTKSSLVKFPTIALFPESMTTNNSEPLALMIDRLWETWEKAMNRFNTDERFTKLPGAEDMSIVKITDDDEHKPGQYWPSLHWVKVKSNSASLQDGLYRTNSWLGGDVELHMNIRKKYGFKFLHTPGTKRHGIWLFFNMYYLIPTAKNLINIYNENQRSNHT